VAFLTMRNTWTCRSMAWCRLETTWNNYIGT